MSPRLRAILAANPDLLADMRKAIPRLLPEGELRREVQQQVDTATELAEHNALVPKGEA